MGWMPKKDQKSAQRDRYIFPPASSPLLLLYRTRYHIYMPGMYWQRQHEECSLLYRHVPDDTVSCNVPELFLVWFFASGPRAYHIIHMCVRRRLFSDAWHCICSWTPTTTIYWNKGISDLKLPTPQPLHPFPEHVCVPPAHMRSLVCYNYTTVVGEAVFRCGAIIPFTAFRTYLGFFCCEGGEYRANERAM